MSLIWNDQNTAVLNGVKVRFANADYSNQKTTPDEIVVLKPKAFFDDYLKMIPDPQAHFNIVELGIFEGGSALILAEMFPNAKIEAFDLRSANPNVLSHIEAMNLRERVRLHYNISQDNESYIKEAVRNNLGGIVHFTIDDASHDYGLTRKSFEFLFQFITANGIYVIEDWGWAHWPGTGFDHWKGVAMSNFVLELVMSSASNPSLIKSVFANSRYAIVTKGLAVLNQTLDIDKLVKLEPRHWSKIQT